MFTLFLQTENAAFQPDPKPEVVRILRVIADRLERGDDFSTFVAVPDINGKETGRAKLSEYL